jgi:hypothetical protein
VGGSHPCELVVFRGLMPTHSPPPDRH